MTYHVDYYGHFVRWGQPYTKVNITDIDNIFRLLGRFHSASYWGEKMHDKKYVGPPVFCWANTYFSCIILLSY